MRSKARQILSSVRQRLLFLCICVFSTVFISANGDPIDAQTTDNSVASRIYYVTIPIDRSVGPYLRQLKILIPDVPAPYNDTKLYDGDTWDQLVDKLLTKRDSNVRDRRSPTQVVVPLPAGCFDSSLSMDKREQCLQNPAAFARGYMTMRLYDVKDGDTLPDVLSRHGVFPTREGSAYYNQQRWSDVVQNFNPRINQWSNLASGSVFILPLLNESESRARDAAKVVAAPAVDSEAVVSNASAVSEPADGTSEAQQVPVEVAPSAPENVPAAPVAPPLPPVPAATPAPTPAPSPKVIPNPATDSLAVKPEASAAKPVPAVVEQAPQEEVIYVDEVPPPTKKIVYAREPQSDISFTVARNVLSSVRIPMLARQSHLNLSYTRTDPGNSDWWINMYQSPIVKGKSDSKYLIETDDPREHHKLSNLEVGTKFYLTAPVPSWSIYAGLYARWMALDLRYWISNPSDESAYLVNRKAFRNVGAGVTAGVENIRGNVRYRFNVAKDLYEFVDQAVHVDRTSGKVSASFNFPKIKERGKTQRHVDLFTESETLNVNLVSDSAMLQVTMKRLSVGVGAGLVW